MAMVWTDAAYVKGPTCSTKLNRWRAIVSEEEAQRLEAHEGGEGYDQKADEG